jgi:hypothetical protein
MRAQPLNDDIRLQPRKGGPLHHYLDAFDPSDFILTDIVDRLGDNILLPLIRSLAAADLRPFVGHDLTAVGQIQEANADRMRLVQTNNPRFHPKTSRANTSVLVLKRGDKALGCVASRLIWCERTLAEEMESGRFWVSNPFTMWRDTDQCIVDSFMARAIKSCPVVFTGSIFLHKSVTGGSVLPAMLRLHYVWLLCHWQWSWGIGLTEGALIRRHVFDIYGSMSLHVGVWRTRTGSDGLHQYEISICEREAAMKAWLRPEMGDLSRPMGRPPKAILPLEGDRAHD